jgi:hypothetical protein
MRLTLLRAKEALFPFSPVDKLEYRLNRVSERYINNAKFLGSMHRIAVRIVYGNLALPRQYRTVEGIKGCHRMDIANHWYEFLPGVADTGYSCAMLRDLGDGLPTLADIPIGGIGLTEAPAITLSGGGGTGARVTATLCGSSIVNFSVAEGGSGYTSAPSVTVGSTGLTAVATVSGGEVIEVRLTPSGTLTVEGAESLTIYGTDINFMPLEVTISGNQTVANTFATIERLHKEQGTANIRLYHTIGTNITNLALMTPTEEETYYRRYFIDSFVSTAAVTVKALVKRRHIEFTADTDVLPINNISALENGLTALQFEGEHDMKSAGDYWASGIRILNDELKSHNGTGATPGLRLIYPGRTGPRFRNSR